MTARNVTAPGNEIGAAAMVLPPKSILCMPLSRCDLFRGRHDNDHQSGDPLDRGGADLFLRAVRIDCGRRGTRDRGEMHQDRREGLPHRFLRQEVYRLVKVFFTDVLLQRRLYRQSRRRWVIHSLIFYPFVFRFLWGMIALLGSLWKPEWPGCGACWTRTNPVTGFLFDLTGIMVILGMHCGVGSGSQKEGILSCPICPNQDRIALTLIGGMVLVGFVLEGMRIAMTGFPDGAVWAFLGYAVAKLFGQGGYLVNLYGYVWYLHAALAGAFLAYIPFQSVVSHRCRTLWSWLEMWRETAKMWRDANTGAHEKESQPFKEGGELWKFRDTTCRMNSTMKRTISG